MVFGNLTITAMFTPLLILLSIISITLFNLGIKFRKPSPFIVCPGCKAKTAGRREISFLGFRHQKCLQCLSKIQLPLHWSFRIIYIIVLAFFSMGMVDPVLGRVDNPIAVLFIIFILIVFIIHSIIAINLNKSQNI
jgi:hypothetical protein